MDQKLVQQCKQLIHSSRVDASQSIQIIKLKLLKQRKLYYSYNSYTHLTPFRMNLRKYIDTNFYSKIATEINMTVFM